MKTGFRIIGLFLLLLLFQPGALIGQEAAISVETSSDTLYAGIPFKLRITLENHGGRLIPPAIDQLKIIGGPNQSSSFSMINGQVKQSSSVTYMLLAEEPGTYRLGQATTEGSGTILGTEEIILNILPSENGMKKDSEEWNRIGGDKEIKEDKPKLKTRKF